MINWFEIMADKLTAIEKGQNELLALLTNIPSTSDANPYGDFNWLKDTCSGVPASTLRIKSAAGEIPGVVKFGKRVLYEKAAVLSWLRSQTRQTVDDFKIEQAAELQLATQFRKRSKRGGVAA